YNRADYLPNAIRSIFAQSYGEIELVVVNGPSTDDTNLVLERLIQQGNRIKVRDCPSRNLSESRNIGIAASSGDVVFFIDDDAVAHREWVSRIMAQYASPQVGAVGGFTIDHTGISFQCKYTVCDRRGNARFLSDLDPAQVLRAGNGFCFPSLLGTNCSFRASELEAIGGFDEVFAYMLDETDVCARIYDRNKLILTVQDAFVFHKYAPSHSRNSERIPTSLLAPARSKVYYSFKHAPEKSLDSHTLFHDITQYRKDIEFANRWYLDHKKISPAHFTKLSKELDQGIAEGLKLGMDSSNFSKTSAHLANWFAGAGQFERIRAPHGGQIPRTDCVAHEPPMRIYFVSQGYPPNDTSGIARWTHECAVRLADRGHEVHVLTRTSSRTDHVDFIDGVWVHFLDDQFDDDQIYAAPIQIPDSISRRATAVL
ncbi:MAG: glycosyltransferase family 2 protein, partial [Burkholderiales bacterium]